MNNPKKRRRLLTFGSDDESESSSPPPPVKRPSVLYAASKPELQQYHAKLTTIGVSGCVEEIFVALDRPVSVGRSSSCTYPIRQSVVSNLHFELHAYALLWPPESRRIPDQPNLPPLIRVKAASGGIFLSCQDVSTNGTLWNGHLIKKTAIIVADGDVLQIPQSQSFCVRIRNKFETNICPPQVDSPSTSSSRPHPSVSYQNIGTHLLSNQFLGDGSFGKVRLAIDTAGQRQLACKTISVSPHAGHNATREVVQKEIDILKGLDHLNINKITDVFYEHAQQNIHIFLELCTGGDLLQFIEERVQVGDGESKYIGLQLMKALNYLHSRKISHRDLKPENVLVHAPGAYPRIMLADFGFAKDNSFERTRSLAGTVSYVPPEALSVLFGYGMGSQAPSFDARRGYEGMPFDCWSLGVCLYFMISGKHPFDYGYDSAENSCTSRRDSIPVGTTEKLSYTPVANTEKRSYWNSPWASFEIDIPSRQRSCSRYSSGNRDPSHFPPAETAEERWDTNDGNAFSDDAASTRTLERDATVKPAKPPNNESRGEQYSYAERYEDSMRSTVSEHMIKKRIMSGPVKFDWMGWGSRPEAQSLISKLLDANPKSRLTIAGALRSSWVVEDLQAMRKMYEKRIGPF